MSQIAKSVVTAEETTQQTTEAVQYTRS